MTRKILVVGASGLIGHAVADELSKNHEVIRASRNGDERVDMSDIDSVRALFERIGDVDDVVCCAGAAPFKHVTELSPEDYEDGLRSKAMGQINVVTEGMKRVADGGSFTLISGILTTVPIHGSVASAVANGAVESYVVTAASELPRGLRINAVSPTVLKEATGYHSAFPGFKQVPAEDVVQAFVRSIEGVESGQVLTVWG
ncbi:short chain dehydrogenase [Rothia koreensis]|jgi:NAD(P)-dependent dehydrogenase (short-subunit alcohol dehydrogenase family)|uniref:short chain dehydrogenase n=1 Tax=Rothia koreensis TaxID=592378 RepID=UPI0037C5229D